MPGALFGLDHVVLWLLQHFVWLYAGVIVFSLVKLIGGLMLITSTLPRIAAAVSVELSFVLMLLFGWQGATYIDEWTMAACNFDMGVTLALAGGGAWSVDSYLARRSPRFVQSRCFQWLGGIAPLPVSNAGFKKDQRAFASDQRGLHRWHLQLLSWFGCDNVPQGAVSPTTRRWSLSEGALDAPGVVSFRALGFGHPHRLCVAASPSMFMTRFSVVRQHVQAHLLAHPLDDPCQEMSGVHPCLDRAERALDSLSPDAHHLRGMIKSHLHRIKNSFVFPANGP